MSHALVRTTAALSTGVLVGAVALGGIASAAPSSGGGSTPTQTTVVNTDAQPVPVKGTVSVGNLPATQQVAGTVDVGNLPATQQVAGTVSVANLPTTQNVSGSVTIANATPLKVESAAPVPLSDAFTQNLPNSELYKHYVVPAGRTALIETASFFIDVPVGATVTGGALYTGGSFQLNVLMQKQGTFAGIDRYLGTQQVHALFPAGTELTFSVCWYGSGTAKAFGGGTITGQLL